MYTEEYLAKEGSLECRSKVLQQEPRTLVWASRLFRLGPSAHSCREGTD